MSSETSSIIQLLENMKGLIPELPSASKEIELIVEKTERLIERIVELNDLIDDQELKIVHLTRQNNEFRALNEQQVIVCEEIEEQLYNLEAKNEKLKEEQRLSNECIKSLSDIITKLEYKYRTLVKTLEKTEQVLENTNTLEEKYIRTNMFLNDEIEKLQYILHSTNENLIKEREKNTILESKLEKSVEELEQLKIQCDELTKNTYSQSNDKKCFCVEEENSHERRSSVKRDFDINNINDQCEEYFDQLDSCQAIIFNIHDATAMTLKDELNFEDSEIDEIDTTAAVDCAVQTDAKLLCCISDESEQINLSVLDNQTGKSHFDNIPKNRRLVELFEKLRLKFRKSKKYTSVATNTCFNTIIVQSDNILVECTDSEILKHKKEIVKGLKSICNQSKDNRRSREIALTNNLKQESASISNFLNEASASVHTNRSSKQKSKTFNLSYAQALKGK